MTGTDMQKNTGPARTEVEKPRGKWKDSHIILLVLPVVLTILFPVGGLFYLCGRFSPNVFSFVNICMAYPLVVVFMFWCFFTGILKLSGRNGKYTANEKLITIAETSVPLFFVGFFLVPFFLSRERTACGPGPGLVVVGLRHRVESEVDIAATRVWLQSLDAELGEYTEGGVVYVDSSKNLSRSELPELLRGLGAGAKLSADENGNARIRIGWGSAMTAHWGVVIGVKDMKIPQSESSPVVRHVVPVEPGVYVWWGE
jgi:hypothetical protein